VIPDTRWCPAGVPLLLDHPGSLSFSGRAGRNRRIRAVPGRENLSFPRSARLSPAGGPDQDSYPGV